MEKRLDQIHKERGISKRCLYNIAHSKDSPAHKVSKAKCSWWYFDEEKLDKWLAVHAGIAFMLMLLLVPTVKTEAATLKADEPLGGFSKMIDDYINAGGEFYTKHDLDVLSAAMELENGCNSDKCLLYTGSVILNRVSRGWADSIEGVLFQGYYNDGYCQQYAGHTVENLYTVEVSKRCRELAARLLLYGSMLPDRVVYQSMRQLGRLYEKVDTEYFCWED